MTDDRGNTDDTVQIRICVLRHDMLFFRLSFGCNWNQPARYRRRVSTRVRSLQVDGAPGISLRTTKSWVADGQMHMIVHFDKPPREGSEISLILGVKWPQRCAPLMKDRRPDSFTLEFGESVARACYRVILPAGSDAFCEPVGFDERDGGFVMSRSSDSEGRPHFLFEVLDLRPRHEVGIKLELKRRGDFSGLPAA